MQIKFIKPHPVIHGKDYKGSFVGAPNFLNAPIKAMNLIMQGYAELIHSCKGCNPYHIEMTEKDYRKPFRRDPQWVSDYCKGENNDS